MIFRETKLKGAYIIELEPVEDKRGYFARTFCVEEFRRHGINFEVLQCNISFNKKRGTLRGMHYQVAPHEEAKLVSCISGAIYDVIVDLRVGSPTYCQWLGVRLAACSPGSTGYKMLYVPKGFAHGFQTLEDNSVVYYQMSEFYHPESASGVRWNDPAFGIRWPEVESMVISDKDSSYRNFSP